MPDATYELTVSDFFGILWVNGFLSETLEIILMLLVIGRNECIPSKGRGGENHELSIVNTIMFLSGL